MHRTGLVRGHALSLGVHLDWNGEVSGSASSGPTRVPHIPPSKLTISPPKRRTFCAGQDLKTWLANSRSSTSAPVQDSVLKNAHGFGSVSRRTMRKPLIAALNGPALGGGAEMLVKCDIVVGYENALVSFPEVRRGKSCFFTWAGCWSQRHWPAGQPSPSNTFSLEGLTGHSAGVVASQGGIPHALHRSPQFAPYLLTGIPIPAALAKTHLFTETVPTREETLPAALRWAKLVTECSPDAVMNTKDQINDWQEGAGVADTARRGAASAETAAMYAGRNIKEGLESFVEVSWRLQSYRIAPHGLTCGCLTLCRNARRCGSTRSCRSRRSFERGRASVAVRCSTLRGVEASFVDESV